MAVVKRRYQQPQVDSSFNMTEMFETLVETEEKKRCIEGYWVGGVWMPGNLYFYVNRMF